MKPFTVSRLVAVSLAPSALQVRHIGASALQVRRLSATVQPQEAAREQTSTSSSSDPADQKDQTKQEIPKKKKTMAELDEELRLKLEGISGDGGASGIEYEGGKAEGLKRGVKDNMFRYI